MKLLLEQGIIEKNQRICIFKNNLGYIQGLTV